MIRKTLLSGFAAMALVFGVSTGSGPALAAGGGGHVHDYSFSFEGPFGRFDQAQLQRGLQVYTEICSACHGLKFVPYRSLAQPGGPSLSEDQMRAYAAQFEVFDPELDDFRTATPTDYFPESALSNAPDLSLMAKARAGFHGPYGTGINQMLRGIGGPEYITSMLLGYTGEESEQAGTILYENEAFGGYMAMAPILYGDDVEYADGTVATAGTGREGRGRLPDVDRRAEDDGAPADRPDGRAVPDHPDGAALLHQQEALGALQAEERLKPARPERDSGGGSGRIRPFSYLKKLRAFRIWNLRTQACHATDRGSENSPHCDRLKTHPATNSGLVRVHHVGMAKSSNPETSRRPFQQARRHSSSEIGAEPCDHALFGKSGGGLIVARCRVVVEAVVHAGIDMGLVSLVFSSIAFWNGGHIALIRWSSAASWIISGASIPATWSASGNEP